MTGEMREARSSHGCSSYNTGVPGETVVLVAGESGGGGGPETNSVERMTVTLAGPGPWEIIGRLPGKIGYKSRNGLKHLLFYLLGTRTSFPMISLGGKIYILGGYLPFGDDGATSSVLVSTDGSDWEETTPLETPRYFHTAVSTETLVCN